MEPCQHVFTVNLPYSPGSQEEKVLGTREDTGEDMYTMEKSILQRIYSSSEWVEQRLRSSVGLKR